MDVSQLPSVASIARMEGRQLSELEKIKLRLDFDDKQLRVQAASLLVCGTTMGILGFVSAASLGIHRFLRHSELNIDGLHFESGHNYYPSTVSEMVADRESPMGKCFFAFNTAAAIAIWMSWYPWRLQNVYIPGDDRLFGMIRVITLRTYVPPVSLMVLASITVVPQHQADTEDLLATGIHAIAATLMIGGYAFLEFYTLDIASGVRIPPTELAVRRVMMMLCATCSLGLICCGPLAQHPGRFGICCGDVWVVPNATNIALAKQHGAFAEEVKDKILAEHMKAGLRDTASGLAFLLKILSYWLEVGAGIFMIGSHFVIWFCCPERQLSLEAHKYLNETRTLQDISDDNSEDSSGSDVQLT
eukprot:TRINITY_DN82076_c0_g1_i1.p1 TRINITY_DN82076_c0_g1~~TRINITY_DN82076_c0_g1_i1.p1  ORF type:complete len:386 (-),score=47.50 TRINITY_DN82076_c0_g1_i1:183-1262(-)